MNIFVGNLEATVTVDELRNVFAVYGTVIDALIIKDTATGAPLGYGHVYLVPDEAARDAIAGLDHALLKGRRIAVRECIYRNRHDRRLNRIPWMEMEQRRETRRQNGHQTELLRQQAAK